MIEFELSRAHEGAGRDAIEVEFVHLFVVDGDSERYQRIIDAGITDEIREIAMGLREGEERQGQARGEARGRAELLLKLGSCSWSCPRARPERAQVRSVDALEERGLMAGALEELWG